MLQSGTPKHSSGVADALYPSRYEYDYLYPTGPLPTSRRFGPIAASSDQRSSVSSCFVSACPLPLGTRAFLYPTPIGNSIDADRALGRSVTSSRGSLEYPPQRSTDRFCSIRSEDERIQQPHSDRHRPHPWQELGFPARCVPGWIQGGVCGCHHRPRKEQDIHQGVAR